MFTQRRSWYLDWSTGLSQSDCLRSFKHQLKVVFPSSSLLWFSSVQSVAIALWLTPFTFSLGNNFPRFWEAAPFINWHTVSYPIYFLTICLPYRTFFPASLTFTATFLSFFQTHTPYAHIMKYSGCSICRCSVSLQERDTQCLGKGCKQQKTDLSEHRQCLRSLWCSLANQWSALF